MKYAAAFIIFGIAFLSWAIALGGWAWLLLWPALSFALAAIAYGGGGPAVFRKRSDGRLPLTTLVLFAPFIGLNTVLWHLERRLRRGRPADQVTPTLYIGRRPLAGEVPAGVVRVVDLTAEFAEPRGVVSGAPRYISFPILDATGLDRSAFAALLDTLADDDVPTLVHCAQGHGRSAMVVCALLVRRGIASDVMAAEQIVRAVRPGVRLSARQRRAVEDVCLDGVTP